MQAGKGVGISGSDAEHGIGRVADHRIGEVAHAAMSAGLRTSADHEHVCIALACGFDQGFLYGADGDANRGLRADFLL